MPGQVKAARRFALNGHHWETRVKTPERRRPRQGLQCAISNSSKCSSDLEPPYRRPPNHGGKLFFYEANIFRLMRFPGVSSSLWVPVLYRGFHCMPQIISQLQKIAVFPGCAPVGEPDALLRVTSHEQRIDNQTSRSTPWQ
jgi:hypothetical protein